MSVTLTNAKKQARYRERHLGVDGEKVRVELNLNATTRAKMECLIRHKGYTITVLVDELIKSAERRATSKLTGKALKVYLDSELTQPRQQARLCNNRSNEVHQWAAGPT